MKIPYLLITGIVIATVGIFLFVILHLQYTSTAPQMGINSNDSALDFSNAIPDNPLGVEAKVVYEVDTLISCIQKCVIPPTPHLVLSSQYGTWFVSYEVCDDLSCKKDMINAPDVYLNQKPSNYNGILGQEVSHINLKDLPWKIGDTVHIKIKVEPANFTIESGVIRYPDKVMIVDLGESKITNATKNAAS